MSRAAVALVDKALGRCSEFVIFWLDLASPSDPAISRGAIHERGLNRTPALITRPSEEPSNAQSEHVQDRIWDEASHPPQHLRGVRADDEPHGWNVLANPARL